MAACARPGRRGRAHMSRFHAFEGRFLEARQPGSTTVVATLSRMIAGPSMMSPARKSSRS